MEDCIIFVRTKEDSERVQKVLFAAGIVWASGSESVHKEAASFIIVDRGRITIKRSFRDLLCGRSAGREFLDAINVTEERFPPLRPEVMITVKGKEYSENTLDLMIRQYVEGE